jgi:uncharacterized protein (DUF1330 family)
MVYVTQLVYVREGREATFQEFEAVVLPLLAKYGGELLLRLRPDAASKIEGSQDLPYELHVVRFANEDDLSRYTNDEERQRLLRLKDESVSFSLVIKGTSV